MKYEDMKKDAKGHIQKGEEFLGSPKYSNDDLESIVDETSCNKMKSQPITTTFQTDFVNSPDGFFRKCQVGSWKELFKVHQEDYVDKRVYSELNSIGMNFD